VVVVVEPPTVVVVVAFVVLVVVVAALVVVVVEVVTPHASGEHVPGPRFVPPSVAHCGALSSSTTGGRAEKIGPPPDRKA
jgi:hypothetical protein